MSTRYCRERHLFLSFIHQIQGSAKPSRRKSRFEKLFTGDAERFIVDALKLRRTILDAHLRLTPMGEQYRALYDVHEAILKALPLVADKPLDDRHPDLGLLPLPADLGTKHRRK